MDAVFVCIVDCFLEHFVIEIEVAFMHTHIEVLSAQVDRIGTGLHTSYQCIPGTSRSKKFNRFTVQYHRWFSPLKNISG